MSSRRSRPMQSRSITDRQFDDLVSKLQSVLPEAHLQSNGKVFAAKSLRETCYYIRSLHRKVDDLSERLSELLMMMDITAAQATIIRSLIV